jgi:hypothetical protein
LVVRFRLVAALFVLFFACGGNVVVDRATGAGGTSPKATGSAGNGGGGGMCAGTQCNLSCATTLANGGLPCTDVSGEGPFAALVMCAVAACGPNHECPFFLGECTPLSSEPGCVMCLEEHCATPLAGCQAD